VDNIKNKKVLVIDDEDDIRAYIEALLEDNGMDVISTSNAKDAMRIIESERPDLITLDVVMPEKSGANLYRALEQDPNLKDIPVIIITGLQPDMDAFICNISGARKPEGYVSKPFEKETLLSEIQKALAGNLAAAAAR